MFDFGVLKPLQEPTWLLKFTDIIPCIHSFNWQSCEVKKLLTCERRTPETIKNPQCNGHDIVCPCLFDFRMFYFRQNLWPLSKNGFLPEGSLQHDYSEIPAKIGVISGI